MALVIAAIGSSAYFTLPVLVPGLEILDPDDPRSRNDPYCGADGRCDSRGVSRATHAGQRHRAEG